MEKNNIALMSECKSSDIKQHEDAVLKTAMQFFADELLPYLGIEELLAKLEQKQNKGEIITKKDLIPLILCPLMSGITSQKDRINKAYHIIRNTTEIEKTDAGKIEAMLYAMADKFLDAMDLEKLKEEMTMTRLGQMIWEDGVEKGKTDTLTQKIRIKLEKGKTVEEIADDLEESTEKIEELMKVL